MVGNLGSGLIAAVAGMERRKVLSSSAVYAIGSLLVVLIARAVVPTLLLPEWTITFLVVLLILGAPVALVLASVFNLTPAGVVSKEPRQQGFMTRTRRVHGRPAAGTSLQPRPSPVTGLQTIDSVAVLPFIDGSPGGDQEYLADGITEELIALLSRVEDLYVPARNSCFAFKGKDVTIGRIGEELGVGAVLKGSVHMSEDQLLIAAELINVEDGHRLWSETYSRELKDIFTVQEEISRAIVAALQPGLVGRKQVPQLQPPAAGTDTYKLYLEARQLLNGRSEAGLQRAEELFQQAIEHSPTYARAYGGLAECHLIRGDYHYVAPQKAFPRAKVAALRALDLDPKLAGPYATLGLIRLLYEWSWADAEWDLRRAIELDPRCAMAHHWLWAYLAVMGRLDEAHTAIVQAQRLDPLSPAINSNLGRHYYFARQYDRAIEQFRRTLERHPNSGAAHFFLGQVYVEKRMYPEAISELEEAVALYGGRAPRIAALARACAIAGRRQEALAWLRELNTRSAREYVSPVYLALIHLGLDERERAFDWLWTAYRQRSSELVWLRVDPKIDPVRDDPRFTQLLWRMKLPAPPVPGSAEPDPAATVGGGS